MRRSPAIGVIVLLGAAGCAWIGGAGRSNEGAADYSDFDRRFAQEVRPILSNYCLGCHSGDQPASALDLSTFESAAEIVSGFGVWEHVSDRLSAGTMPPAGTRQPSASEREIVLEYLEDLRGYEARRNAGDPGVVLAHRLSNAELNYTIQDLTGVDIRPAKEFPVDPANAAGFDNTGESLAISPALLTRYLDAARLVADHLVLKPEGFAFAPHVTVTDVDRDRYVVNRIMDFYRAQPTDLGEYIYVIWRYENRAALGEQDATLAGIAREERVSPAYAETLRPLLTDSSLAYPGGPVAEIQRRWAAMPDAGSSGSAADAREASAALASFVKEARLKLAQRYVVPRARQLHVASQILVMHANRAWSSQRRVLNTAALVPADQAAANTDPLLVVPAGDAERAAAIASLERFCDIVPDHFLITERTSTWLAANQTGRLLSAGFHSADGYYRDDGPLYDLILDDAARREIDALWDELNFVANAPARQLSGFVWFERTDTDFMMSEEFGHLRPEHKDLGSAEKFASLHALFLAKAERLGLAPEFLASTDLYFTELGAALRWTEEARLAAEPSHLEALLAFAERAYRRPLNADEEAGLLDFYRRLRVEDDLSHEDAIRDAVVSVLVSPNFSYRVDLAASAPITRVGDQRVAPIESYSLASRLSYFLWSSMPDEELLAHAAAGDLNRPEVLRAQVRRMLADPKVNRLATEFATNWLGVRRFEEFNSVGRERFPMFTNELRQAFFEEPIRFFTSLVQEDRPVLDLLFADYTYVNGLLAEHYGIPFSGSDPAEWVRVENADQYGRGGLLPMGVFLTNYATGLRTSPVKRGHWVASRVLGQHIPAPPPNVPELPSDEADLGGMTLVQLMARHREDPSCASCHATFDHFGIAFEGYGAVGERREVDFGGRPVQAVTDYPNGMSGDGYAGLLRYLEAERRDDFVDNIARRVATYALGRQLLLSDEALIENMKRSLSANGERFSALVEAVVTSPQFLSKRVPEDAGAVALTLSSAQ